MLQQERKIIVKLNETLNALIIIKKNGQDSPSQSDKVTVICYIGLPKLDSSYNIEESLRFGHRVNLCDEPCVSDWGYNSNTDSLKDRGLENNYKYRYNSFYGEKWNDLFIEAEIWAENELSKLIEAIDKRRKALENAED